MAERERVVPALRPPDAVRCVLVERDDWVRRAGGVLRPDEVVRRVLVDRDAWRRRALGALRRTLGVARRVGRDGGVRRLTATPP